MTRPQPAACGASALFRALTRTAPCSTPIDPPRVPPLPPEICPECGAEVPRKARACPHCGADEQTGWSDRAQAQRLDLPEDEFDYEGFVKEEFGDRRRPTDRIKPRHLSWLWWVVALLLALAFAYSYLGR
jgi:hypothetical protein